ncbi:helix-turn-helix transcriptional regulator [candidate division KSB1 bacterium]|nr:helix-turn-helix transcriptional regulator [candidate division KSB1 bacterium]MBL7092973.1 helix-turn-helix transcriptional regulator [candidate division KSB1 bacterium]
MSKLITKFRNLLIEKSNQNLSELASHIGISRVTLYSLMYDNWKQIQRETIEKVCDYFNCEINDLFAIEENPFWLPFLQKGDFCFIYGGTKVNENKDVVGFWDIKVMSEVTTHLNKLCGKDPVNFSFISTLDFGDSMEKVIDFIKMNNTIIIGSPKNNVLTEYVLAKLYKAEPFNPEKKNRDKIPMRFVRPKNWGISTEKSTVSNFGDQKNMRGVFSHKSNKIIAYGDWFDNFYNRQVELGKDCAILVVVNKPFETAANVKLIILAGFTGLSSYGAAQLLIKHSNNLEPATSKPLVKAIQLQYKKLTLDKDDREITKISFVQEK